ncbi:MAG: hypothetical protein E7I00_03930, partial [Varibaculum cambriense]|nr:hypothetical protein [Varibaculum cambriense]
ENRSPAPKAAQSHQRAGSDGNGALLVLRVVRRPLPGREALSPVSDWYLQHRRSALAEKLLLQYQIVPRLYEPDTAVEAVSSLI